MYADEYCSLLFSRFKIIFPVNSDSEIETVELPKFRLVAWRNSFARIQKPSKISILCESRSTRGATRTLLREGLENGKFSDVILLM